MDTFTTDFTIEELNLITKALTAAKVSAQAYKHERTATDYKKLLEKIDKLREG
jgi:hypothetical protein